LLVTTRTFTCKRISEVVQFSADCRLVLLRQFVENRPDLLRHFIPPLTQDTVFAQEDVVDQALDPPCSQPGDATYDESNAGGDDRSGSTSQSECSADLGAEPRASAEAQH
jgi:hypothetical protein